MFDVLTMSAPELRSRPCRQQLRPVTLPGKQLFGRVDHRQHRKSPTFAAVDDGANVLEHVDFVRRADHHLHRNRVGAVPQGDFHRADQGEVVLRGDDVGQVEDRAAPVGVLPPDTARQAGVEDHWVGAAGDDLPNRGCRILDTRDRALNHPVVERHHDRLSGACVDYAHVAHGFSDVDHARAVSPAARRVSSILSSRIQERNPGNTHIGDLGKMAVMSEYRPYKWPAAPLEIVLPGLVNSNLNASMTLSEPDHELDPGSCAGTSPSSGAVSPVSIGLEPVRLFILPAASTTAPDAGRSFNGSTRMQLVVVELQRILVAQGQVIELPGSPRSGLPAATAVGMLPGCVARPRQGAPGPGRRKDGGPERRHSIPANRSGRIFPAGCCRTGVGPSP